MRRSISESGEMGDTIEVSENVPATQQSNKCVEISSHLKDLIVATRLRALAAKADCPVATASSHTRLWLGG
jgi:hypothetical protein